jgi:hypothetical protein
MGLLNRAVAAFRQAMLGAGQMVVTSTVGAAWNRKRGPNELSAYKFI